MWTLGSRYVFAAPPACGGDGDVFVGSLRLVGEGKWQLTDLKKALAARDRTEGGETAPAGGLFLTDVTYPPDVIGAA